MKTCTKCNQIKDKSAFGFERNQCYDCRYEMKKARPQKKFEITVTEQKCQECNTIKPASEFNRNSSHTTGLLIYCKDCRKEHSVARYQKDPEAKKAQSSNYYYNNKDKAIACANEYRKMKCATDPFYVLCRRLRNRLYCAMKNTTWKKNTKFNEYIGCDRETLMSHIESQFVDGMSWDNRSKWHIDHKIPLISAKTEQELYALCHYTNLQPMWAVDNIKKGGRY